MVFYVQVDYEIHVRFNDVQVLLYCKSEAILHLQNTAIDLKDTVPITSSAQDP